MEEVNESIKFINEKIEEMEADRKEKERQISEPKNEAKYLNEKVETMYRSLDHPEQYSRKNCLLIHCVRENEKDDTDEVVIEFFEKKWKKNYQPMRQIDPIDLEKSKAEVDLGFPSTWKKTKRKQTSAIIIKFTRYNVRNVIFRKKKTLKSKTITENLTKKRITEMKVARKTYGFKNVWSQYGKILYTDANDTYSDG